MSNYPTANRQNLHAKINSHDWKTNSKRSQVYIFLTLIPKGKVVTYGQIAEHLGNKRLARVVGNILHNNPDPLKYPCYKVVNAKGELSCHFGDGGITVQKERLEKDGVEVENYSVDLNKYQWNGDLRDGRKI